MAPLYLALLGRNGKPLQPHVMFLKNCTYIYTHNCNFLEEDKIKEDRNGKCLVGSCQVALGFSKVSAGCRWWRESWGVKSWIWLYLLCVLAGKEEEQGVFKAGLAWTDCSG